MISCGKRGDITRSKKKQSPWLKVLEDNLPEHARKAGRDTNQGLARQLGAVAGQSCFLRIPSSSGLSYDAREARRGILALLGTLAPLCEKKSVGVEKTISSLRMPMDSKQRKQALLETLREHFHETFHLDSPALERWLDAEAIENRFTFQTQLRMQEVEHLVQVAQALGVRTQEAPSSTESKASRKTKQAKNADELLCLTLTRIFENKRYPWHLRAATCRLLIQLSLHGRNRSEQDGRQAVLRRLAESDEEPFVLVAAMESYIPTLEDKQVQARLLRRLLCPSEEMSQRLPRDHCFLRARGAVLCIDLGHSDIVLEMLESKEASDHVRLEAIGAICASDDPACIQSAKDWFARGYRKSRKTQRAAAAIASLQLLSLSSGGPKDTAELAPTATAALPGAPLNKIPFRDSIAIERLGFIFRTEGNPFIITLTCRALLDRQDTQGLAPELATKCLQTWGPLLEARMGASYLSQEGKRTVSLLLLLLRVIGQADSREAFEQIGAARENWREGETHHFKGALFQSMEDEQFLEVLALAAADDFDLSAKATRQGYRVSRGSKAHFSWWRLIHEWRTPAPDKRQAFSHTTDSSPRGNLLALSHRLAEVTPTRVPGQRVGSAAELEWGAELPLPEHFIHAAREKILHIHTGIESYSIRRMQSRIAAMYKTSTRYVKLTEERERLLQSAKEASSVRFDASVEDLGFAIERRSLPRELESKGGTQTHRNKARQTDPTSAKLGQALLPAVPPAAWDFFSFQGNTPVELFGLASGIIGAWMLRSALLHQSARQARRKIPLVIGGWGSRGKSGTERLKAGLFHGMGYRVVAKTTGCEAMIIASIPPTKPTEVFLFRPYDKATIWEQHEVLKMGAALSAQVFLWECMALKPDFVSILQHDWMTDDIATITNTYPDHEDIQGPSGRNVADVISKFIPPASQAISSEQHMEPVLREQARAVSTAFETCRAEEWSLLPEDLLARFPYLEHPRNIALVLRLAASLDIPRDVALKTMADHVVPDLGVLREYGPITYKNRTISFINGMSANERAGFTSNWSRMELAKLQPSSGLKSCLALVLNNRGDRPARSAAFVEITVQDAAADAVYVIGTNVRAFAKDYKTKLRHELNAFVVELKNKSTKERQESLSTELSRRLRRVPLSKEEASAVLFKKRRSKDPRSEASLRSLMDTIYASLTEVENMLMSFGPNPPDSWHKDTHEKRWLCEVCWLWHLREDTYESAGGDESSLAHIRDVLVTSLLARFYSVQNPNISGDALIRHIAERTPADCRTRLLGCQNIKGTGLDFVYQWISLDETVSNMSSLKTGTREQVGASLSELRSRKSLGLTEAEYILSLFEDEALAARISMMGFGSDMDACILLCKKVRASHTEGAEHKSKIKRKMRDRTGLSQQAKHLVEESLDFIDSIRRKRDSERLRRDLIHRRVGQKRAAAVAQSIVSRQKGGWLFPS